MGEMNLNPNVTSCTNLILKLKGGTIKLLEENTWEVSYNLEVYRVSVHKVISLRKNWQIWILSKFEVFAHKSI